ncbi:MAG: FHA domain-containing protein [Hahellaceae bacterium]|nr:FHA domain-containing protein [Hahellaceae bacterium]
MLKLQFIDGSRESIWLVDAIMKIGGDSSNNLILQGDGIAPFHAEILLQGEELSLKPVNPQAAVMINDKRIAGQQKLSIDDVISVGKTQLKIVTPGAEAKAKSGTKPVETSEWFLEIHASWAKQSRFPIRENAIVGRDESCDISVPVNHLSRQHARLTPAGGFLLVKDLDSTNGTFLNGEKITQGRAKSGDKLRFDVVTFEVIGPTRDDNRTVVRQAKPIANAAPSAPSSTASRPVPVVKATTATKTPTASAQAARPKSTASAVPPPPAETQSAESGSGSSLKWIILAGVILAVVAGIAAVMM